MASKPILTSADLLDKKVILELEKLDLVMEEITATEKELTAVTIQLGKIQSKNSKEAVKRQEKVLKTTKKVNTLKTKQIDLQIKHNSTLEKAVKIRKKEESGVNALTNKWNKLQLTINKAVAAYAAIMVFVRSFNRLKETVLILDSFNVLMEKVTGNTADAADSMAYLIQISKDFGISLREATQRYSKFYAAANQAGLTTKETRKIFTSMSKTSGILSLRAEELRGVFLALEQMLSKGKVTTEELRRQLGERLPGAFGIMARAVGVSTAELDVMLKKGEILSAEILPKFAEEMEKAFGIENVDRIDTLVAAVERADTAYFELIREIENGGAISSTIKTTYNLWTQYVEQFTQAVIDSRNEHLKWYEQLTSTAFGAIGLGSFYGLTPEARENQKRDEEKVLLAEKLSQLQTAFILDTEHLTEKQKKQFDIDDQRAKNAELPLKQLRKEILLYEALIKKTQILNTETSDPPGKKPRAHVIKTEVIATSGLIEEQEKLVKTYEKLAKAAPNEETAQVYIRMAEATRRLVKELKKLDVSSFDPEGVGLPTGTIGGGKTTTRGEDFKIWLAENDEEIQTTIALSNELFNLGNAIFERNLENINAEILATEDKYDRMIQLAEGDDEKQRQLEVSKLARLKKLEAEELKIRQKQARLEKAQAVFNAGINTALAITKVMPNPYLIALVAALGALQIATIAASPVPQYKMGRKGGKAEWAITGDGGRSEIVSGKSGAYKTPAKPTLTYLEKGDSVYKNENAYKEMLRRSTYQSMDKSTQLNFDAAIERGFKKAKINNYLKLPTLKVDMNHQMWLNKNSQF